jgi:glycosyltransferase involved in cell wall biosynthesis
MRNVAQDRRVLFVNSIGMRMPTSGNTTMPIRRIGRKVRSVAKLVRHPLPEVPGFTVMTPVTVPLYQHQRIRRLNALLVAAQVRVVAALHGIGTPACMVTIPTAWDVVQHVPHGTLIYNRSDMHSAFPEADTTTIEQLEQALLLGADHVLYVSRSLMTSEASLTEGRAVFLDHGVDLSLFRRVAEDAWPPEVASIPRPRIGYFGALRDYVVDLGLLQAVAEAIPEAQLVLVGGSTCSMDALVSLPNVHWLGARDYEEIPCYGSAFDVALMPWLDNEWIRNCNPIKMKEYLALGLPVISIDFPEVRRYADVISVADSATDFVSRVRQALGEKDSETQRARRRAAVADASWVSRADVVERLVDRSGHR